MLISAYKIGNIVTEISKIMNNGIMKGHQWQYVQMNGGDQSEWKKKKKQEKVGQNWWIKNLGIKAFVILTNPDWL